MMRLVVEEMHHQAEEVFLHTYAFDVRINQHLLKIDIEQRS
jgi:hypothetical protein